MKHGRWQRMAAVALAICLSAGVATPANALSWSSSGSSSSWWNSWTDSWNNFWDGIFGGSEQEQGGTLTLVENETTVTEGTELRADTYALEQRAATTLKYFPVTLYNYDDTYNQAMHQYEVDNETYTSTWNGIYFGGNGHGANVKDGDSFQSSSGYTKASPTYNNILNRNKDSWQSTNYYYEVDGSYYPLMAMRSSELKGSIFNWHYEYTYTFGYQKNGKTNHIGNPVKTTELDIRPSITVYTKGSSTIKLGYADYNRWTGDFGVSGQEQHGNKTYSGLVQNQLDRNNNIVFTKPDAGVFNDDDSIKDIYTNVGLPFVFEDGYYTFDANTTGAYFHTDSEQGTSSTPTSNTNLFYSETAQSHNFSAQDGRTKGWFPFNDASSVTTGEEGNADYFFGMQAAIPFTMTSNGKISPTDDSSDDIIFEFSGDDDVWVFIDGQLVLDLGGVHNGMNGTINFADNTWSVEAMVGTIGDTKRPAEDVNKKALNGTLFNTEWEKNGVLGTDRETFAARDEHTLTVFYLERGAGSSNCKIRFNLPIKDSVSVQKQVSRTDSAEVELTDEQWQSVSNTYFNFKLYRNDKVMAGSSYLLYDINGQYVRTATTGLDGTFRLKNGEMAKFIGEIGDNDSYRVVETVPETWETPEWTYTAKVSNDYTGETPVAGDTSMTVTADGSNEAEDTISFVCSNTWKHVNGTSIDASDDQIVVDYGLPVLIDVLGNDTANEGVKSIERVEGAKFGTATVENGKIKYTLTEPLTDVEVLTYTAKAANENGVDVDTDTATVYIIPATTMYYEENFSTNFVTFTGPWEDRGSETNPYQENDTGSSPYGSDVAYLDDSGDSNGTSKYVSTEGLASSPSFSYTFTGTGTTFFARTTKNTAYMKVVITNQSGDTVYELMRDTSYKASEEDPTLYNIPVFTYNAENYGTYTVTVTLARNVVPTMHYGTDFWLDGIRVYNPMDVDSDYYKRATDAYSWDGEANMTNVTLREKLLADYTVDKAGNIVWDGVNFVVFTDTNGKIQTASEYQSNGPKEEVYLNDGQSVTFSLADWDRNSYDIYLGIKAPMGSGSVTINGHPLTINNTCDCYYDISNYVTMMGNVGTFEIKAIQGVISVTNIKVTGDAEFTIVGGPDIDA